MKQFKGLLNSKLPQTDTSIFAVMSHLAVEHEAINLSQGFPDFMISPELIRLVNKYMRKGFNQYAPMPGVIELRRVISQKVKSIYKTTYDPINEINITAGATQALYTAISCVIKEDDEVIVFEPAYDSYVPAIKLNGGIVKYSKLQAPDYNVDWTEVQKMITGRTKMIIINSPHNPTGSILSGEDMQNLEKITQGTDIIILSDEVYEHLIFDKKKHESVCSYPGLAERSFVIGSFGKTFHATGWKMGYCLAPENLMAEFRKVHQFVVFACNTPVQYAMTDFLQDKDNYTKIWKFYQDKRDYFISLIKDSRFKLNPSRGTYFQLLDYSEITDEKETDFAIRLTKDYGLASIPVSVFYNKPDENQSLRFCFAKKEETLEKAAKILCKI
ncbi:MAG: aminotransferase class I/II-fold pyridoxal phosphate-dependent enzyme [Bacteroidales bacterium]|nr:aminotransferase class I/II-fold pyridoxal phosphate-dependent enzyme [Bacteroidales bacterium]